MASNKKWLIYENDKKILISIATYKESENIVNLINKIRKFDNFSKILVINDFSNDNTKELLNDLNDQNFDFIERPTKLGLGTAHKLSILYAIKNNYDFLLTMDADFSHDPSDIPKLVDKCGLGLNLLLDQDFVKEQKAITKELENNLLVELAIAKKLLNIKLNEITTYFRAYSVNLLRKLPYDELNAQI